MPIFSNKIGNNKATKKQANQSETIEIDIAFPRTLFGKTSEIMTQVTGPRETANEAINTKMAVKVIMLSKL